MTVLQDLLLDVVGQDIYDKLANTPQSAKWHAEGSVLNHTLMVMEEVAKDDFEDFADYQLFMATAIVHDLGKLDTTRVAEDGKITSYNHETEAYGYIHSLRGSLMHHFADANLQDIWSITAEHMRAHLYRSGKLKNPAKRKMFEEQALFDKIMRFSEYDERGRIGS